jgi:hypothetical protein
MFGLRVLEYFAIKELPLKSFYDLPINSDIYLLSVSASACLIHLDFDNPTVIPNMHALSKELEKLR